MRPFIYILIILSSFNNCHAKQYKMGIVCLELDDLMRKTLYTIYGDGGDSFDYMHHFQPACRIPVTYIKILALKNIKFMPIFYTNNNKDVFLE